MERQCLYCHEAVSGRVDKKFCSDQCRNAFNNEKNAGNQNLVRRINNVLRNNRRVLESVSGQINKKIVSAASLTNSGFNYLYFTSTYTTKKGHIYFFCYEYGYLKLGDDKVMIVKRDNHDI